MAAAVVATSGGKRRFCDYNPGGGRWISVGQEEDEEERVSENREQDNWKPGICGFFQSANGCKKGENCPWPHSEEQLKRFEAERKQSNNGWWESGAGGGSSSTARKGYKWVPCAMYQVGCCIYDADCFFAHVPMAVENNPKIYLCKHVARGGQCYKSDCEFAHSSDELVVPNKFKGMSGYKGGYCSWYLLHPDGCKESPCMSAHVPQELRRLPIAIPRSLVAQDFVFYDSHIHLDHLLYSRKFGAYWFYKFQTCKRRGTCIYTRNCMFVHEEKERQVREITESDFVSLVEEIHAVKGDFRGMVHNCCDLQDIPMALKLVEWGRRHLEGKIYITFGIHPTNFEEFNEGSKELLLTAIRQVKDKVVGWGECGLDYYRRQHDIATNPSSKQLMKESFRKQATFAVKQGLPLVLHSREAEEDTLEVMYSSVPQTHRVHLHSFMGSVSTALEFLRLYPNGFIGIAGVASYPSAQVAGSAVWDLVTHCPLERLLLETDGPFMAPDPYRGEESTPAHIPWIAAAIAKQKQVSVEEVLAVTYRNFERMYLGRM
mmetsp:Transcript_71261/g.148987  ORF Transcript_71261/g.148987 Transcript_71261/m.148987 type:complete len:545 (+) Transcript_71261:298-1932(+)